MKSVLDTVTVTARLNQLNMRGFEERRRGGLGRFLGPEDIARRNPIVASDIFRMVPGLTVERSELGSPSVAMRGIFAETCVPAVYLDGHFMSDLTADDIDSWVKPKEIAGIEVYVGPAVPPQFTTGMAGSGITGEVCGSIVIWTKMRSPSR
jgi:outer membrane receptor for ferrienterochelin and colicin